MPGDARKALLSRLRVVGVAGLPDLDLELGPVTALIGKRGSGKSQLLTSIAWLLNGRPRLGARDQGGVGHVAADVQTSEGPISVVRPFGIRSTVAPGSTVADTLLTCSFLRARSRLGVSLGRQGVNGRVSAGLAARGLGATSDALAAETLLPVIQGCCDENLSGEILLIEEPELMLTPQAQRYLYRLLRRFAENGNQVLYSTRSPAFLDAARHEEILRLDLRPGPSTSHRTSPDALSDAERVRLAAQFDHERSEMFFGEAVVLVEGQTERLSIPFIFRALGHDPDAEGIAIVEVGGKSNLPPAARLLRQLGIPFVAVFDADRGPASAALDAQISRAAGPERVIRLVPDFEAAAGLHAHTDKVLQAWQRFSLASDVTVPTALRQVVAKAVAAARGMAGNR